MSSCSILAALARAFSVDADRDDAGREKDQRDDGEFPIHVEQHATPLMIATGCLNRSLLMLRRARSASSRVSFVMRDIRKPERILLKKSIE